MKAQRKGSAQVVLQELKDITRSVLVMLQELMDITGSEQGMLQEIKDVIGTKNYISSREVPMQSLLN